MYTRCLGCHTVHPVNAVLLAQGSGKYRCGKCKKVGNALEALFDEWPQAKQQGARPGNMPELGLALAPNPASEPGTAPEDSDLSGEFLSSEKAVTQFGRRLLPALWVSATLVLTAVISLSLASFFQQPILDHPQLQEIWVKLGLKKAPPKQPFRALDQIELLSRELVAHPTRPGTLLLTASMVNRAEVGQVYPDINVILLDINGRQLVQKVFKPRDYLPDSAELRRGMTPQAYLSFSLEIPDPGNGAVGFELQFR